MFDRDNDHDNDHDNGDKLKQDQKNRAYFFTGMLRIQM